MSFNTLPFAIFLSVVFILYWFVFNRSKRHQNILLLMASYFFYGYWDWRFLFLLAFSTMLDYITGIQINKADTEIKRKTWLFNSVSINIGILFFFKYYNFFVHPFAVLLGSLGFYPDLAILQIILPIGISFYTFHGLSYVFDVYNKKIQPTTDVTDYALFVSFFPLLVAGPIERATHLLPQVKNKRIFDYDKAVDGLRQILWGLFKKIVIADGVAEFVNNIFNYPDNNTGSTAAIGAVFFAIQIYCDFSGYSDIAIGTGRLFGFDLLRNFAFPYFSRDIAEFWRRWHISLTSWFKDYIYIPLGGNRGTNWQKIRNVFIVFLLSGLWHGANITFLVWGMINAILILPLILFRKNRNHLDIVAKGRILPTFKELLQIAGTFCLTCFAWIFFRSKTIADAFHYIANIFKRSLFQKPYSFPLSLLFFIVLFILLEWTGRENKYATEKLGYNNMVLRWAFNYFIAMVIILYPGIESQFIYFQF